MDIGVDATCYANPRGYGRFTRQVLPAMVERAPDDRFVCFLDWRAAQQFDLQGHNVHPVVVDLSTSPTLAASADSRRSVADLLRLSRAVWREAPDVFFSPSVYSFFPLPPGMRAVITIHDTIVERFPELTLPTRASRLFWRLKVRAALAQATLVLTVSDYSAAEIASVLKVSPRDIRVALEAPAPTFRPATDPLEVAKVAERLGIPPASRWIMYVGGFNPHKNVDDAVRAHARLVRMLGETAPRLVLVGPVDEDVFHGSAASIRAAIDAEGTVSLVHWTGFLSDEDLCRMYSGAVALVLPSSAEGFGLPAVEAACCGTPVVATTASPLPDLLAGAGFFVAPRDITGLADAFLQLSTDAGVHRRMSAAAIERTSVLNWGRTADAVLSALREASESRRARAATAVA
jgi:glycosyltransferase involved in cell wall biosynthesis